MSMLSPRGFLKGQCHEIFDFWFFSSISFPQAYEYTSTAISNFSKIRGDIRGSRCTTGVNDTGGKWKKSSSSKISIILFGHLLVVELAYIYIFAFKFTSRYLQPDICHRCQHHMRNWWQNLPPVSLIPVANLQPVSLIPAAILPLVSLTPVANLPPVVHLYLQISPRIFEKI
jgi:hypothetical protein